MENRDVTGQREKGESGGGGCVKLDRKRGRRNERTNERRIFSKSEELGTLTDVTFCPS